MQIRRPTDADWIEQAIAKLLWCANHHRPSVHNQAIKLIDNVAQAIVQRRGSLPPCAEKALVEAMYASAAGEIPRVVNRLQQALTVASQKTKKDSFQALSSIT